MEKQGLNPSLLSFFLLQPPFLYMHVFARQSLYKVKRSHVQLTNSFIAFHPVCQYHKSVLRTGPGANISGESGVPAQAL